MLYVPVANGLKVIVFEPAIAVVVALTQTHKKLIVHASLDVKVKFGTAVPVFVTAHAVNEGGVVSPPQPPHPQPPPQPPPHTETVNVGTASQALALPAASVTLIKQSEYVVPLVNALKVMVFDPAFAVVVALEHAQTYAIVPASSVVNAKLGVTVFVLLTAHAVNIGDIISVTKNAVQEPPYDSGSQSQIQESGS